MSKSESYLVLYPDGSYRNLVCERSQLLYEFQDAIGCEIFELVRTEYGFMMAVDESGVISGRQQINPYASCFYAGAAAGSFIFGPVIFCCEGFVDGEPDIVPVPPLLLARIKLCIEGCEKF